MVVVKTNTCGWQAAFHTDRHTILRFNNKDEVTLDLF